VSRRAPWAASLALAACAPPGARSAPSNVETTCLDADGPGGVETYPLIESVLGSGSLELPDSFHQPAFAHVQEEDDPDVGPSFVFFMHRDVDRDPVNHDRTDRQRCELKVFDRSPEHLKGYENTAFSYTWRFKISGDVPVSRRFLHLFQLKAAKSPDDDHPVLTLTGALKSGAARLEIRHSASREDEVLAEAPWERATGVWLEASVRARYSDRGSLAVTIARTDGTPLIDFERDDIDLWRGGGFVRPKWGIYRSLADRGRLTNAEDTVRFAGIGITPDYDAPLRCTR
jgi:hypothetical protein